jgi:hypothetical protein
MASASTAAYAQSSSGAPQPRCLPLDAAVAEHRATCRCRAPSRQSAGRTLLTTSSSTAWDTLGHREARAALRLLVRLKSCSLPRAVQVSTACWGSRPDNPPCSPPPPPRDRTGHFTHGGVSFRMVASWVQAGTRRRSCRAASLVAWVRLGPAEALCSCAMSVGGSSAPLAAYRRWRRHGAGSGEPRGWAGTAAPGSARRGGALQPQAAAGATAALLVALASPKNQDLVTPSGQMTRNQRGAAPPALRPHLQCRLHGWGRCAVF